MTKKILAPCAFLAALVAGSVVILAQTQHRFPGTVIAESDLRLENIGPGIVMYESDAGVDQKYWRVNLDTSAFQVQLLTDGFVSPVNALRIGRSGTTPSLTVGVAGGGVAEMHVNTSASATTGGLNFGSGTARITSITGNNDLNFDAGGGTTEFTVTNGNAVFTATGVAINRASATPFQVNRQTTDGTIIALMQDGVEEGTIAVSGTTVSYNAFMGSHYTQTKPGQVPPEAGTVVVSTGEQIPGRNPADLSRFVYVRPSTRRNERAVYGVWFAELARSAAGMSWGDPAAPVFQVAGIGQGEVLVTDTCGNIRAGELLATSPRPGLAERQCTANGKRYDGVARDHTLGRALVDVDFSRIGRDATGARRARIPASLRAG